jgi:hypothetical protein
MLHPQFWRFLFFYIISKSLVLQKSCVTHFYAFLIEIALYVVYNHMQKYTKKWVSMIHFSSSDNDPSQAREDDLLQGVLTQLSRATMTMQHIDEVFLWLVHTIVNRFGVSVAQVWAMQSTITGQRSPQLRSVMCQDASLPQNIVVNTQIAALAGRMLNEQHTIQLRSVEAYFSQYLALLLRRYGVHYCTGCFVHTNMLLPPPRQDLSAQKTATPLAMVLFLFFQHMPNQNILPTIQDIVAQTLPIASSRGFLLTTPASSDPIPPSTEPPSSTQLTQKALVALIPRRAEDPMSNPLSAAKALSEQQLRQVYAVINDRRNIAELCKLTNLDLQDVLQILQKLVVMHLVQIHEPTGRRVENISLYNE